MNAPRTRIARWIAVWLGLSLCLGACVEKPRRISKADRELLKEIVSKTAPRPAQPVDFRFDTNVRLIGYDLSDARVVPGRPFKVTWYWQVDKALGEGWKAFTHLADGANKNRVNMDANRLVRDLYPASEWQGGEFITDTQEITLPEDWGSSTVRFYLGFWNGPHRLHITRGEHDGDNRAKVLEIPVKGGAAPGAPTLPELKARRTRAPITLDGKLDEADWASAGSTGAFVNTLTGDRGSFDAKARVLYDAQALYVGFQVQDDYLKCSFEKLDDHLWEQDTVEVMVDPDGDGLNYFEMQVSPTELVFDTRYDSRRKPQPFGHVDWNSGLSARAAVRGEVNDDEADEGYVVEMAIPWTAFAAGKTPASPPAAGARMRMNFFVMDARDRGQQAVGWSAPRVGDFHTLDKFGWVSFPDAAQ